MAKLKMTVDSLDDVEEQFRPLYAEKDGKFHLDAEGSSDDATPAQLKAAQAALKRANDDAAKRRKQLENWEKLGKTPEEIVEALKQQEDLKLKQEELEAQNKGEWDKLRQQMNEKHAGDIKKLQDQLVAKDREIHSLQSMIENNLVETNAVSAIVGEKGIPQLLLPAVKRHIKVVDENGQKGIQVVDEKGEPRVNGKGEPLTLSELVSEMRSSEIYGRAFEGTGSSGSGARPNNGGAPPGNINRRSDFKSEAERAAYIDKYGLKQYQALPA